MQAEKAADESACPRQDRETRCDSGPRLAARTDRLRRPVPSRPPSVCRRVWANYDAYSRSEWNWLLGALFSQWRDCPSWSKLWPRDEFRRTKNICRGGGFLHCWAPIRLRISLACVISVSVWRRFFTRLWECRVGGSEGSRSQRDQRNFASLLPESASLFRDSPFVLRRARRRNLGLPTKTGVPSASVAVVKSGKIAYVHAYGYARLDPKVLALPDMSYSIGSVSKQFTVAVVLFLVEQHKLSLDDPVSRYLPTLTAPSKSRSANCSRIPPGIGTTGPQDYLFPDMLSAVHEEEILDRWAPQAARLRSGHEVGIQQHQLCHRQG